MPNKCSVVFKFNKTNSSQLLDISGIKINYFLDLDSKNSWKSVFPVLNDSEWK